MKKRCPYCGDEFEASGKQKYCCPEHRWKFNAVKNKEGRRAAQRAWKKRNPDKVRAHHRAYNKRHPAKRAAYQERYRAENRERRRQACRLYYQENKDELLKKRREWWTALSSEEKQKCFDAASESKRLKRVRLKNEVAEELAALEMLEDAFVIEQLVSTIE